MKRTTSFVRNFHFGNTVKFMANKTKEFIIYTAEYMRAYFGVCDKEKQPMKNYAPENNFQATAPKITLC